MERRIKKIPIFMDILFEDFLDQEQVREVLSLVAKKLSESKSSLSLENNKIKEIRILVKDNVLMVVNPETGDQKIEILSK